MSSTQLNCPHCGSLLNFGMVIPPGTAISCLICSQTFRAAPAAVPPIQTAKPAAPAASPVQLAKPTAATPVSKPARPAPRTPFLKPPIAPAEAERTSDSSWAGLLAVLGLLLLVGSVLGYTLWQMATTTTGTKTEPEDIARVDTPAKAPPPVTPPAEVVKPAVAAPKKSSAPPPPPDKEDPEDGYKKPRTEKVKLERPTPRPPDVEAPTPTITKREVGLPAVWGVSQERIDQASARGLRFVRIGSWEHPEYKIGHYALGGLTLLECGVNAADPQVQAAAAYLRTVATDIQHPQIYQASLVILFLDRLGEPGDRRLIQALAMRLLASQTKGGGWTYYLKNLPVTDLAQLYVYLYSQRPAHMQNARLPDEKKRRPGVAAVLPQGPFRQFGALLEAAGIEAPPGPGKAGPAKKTLEPLPVERLAEEVRNLPIVLHFGKRLLEPIEDDNSNTQFALLALWAARRHDVPVEEALLNAQRRFERTQNPDGGWRYTQGAPMSTPAMAAVGLLSLAMGYATEAEMTKTDLGKLKADDPTIRRALQFLGGQVGTPAKGPDELAPPQSLYVLWTLERTAMLYDLRTIGGKDWFGWGAQNLLVNQKEDGSWHETNFIASNPHVTTCLSLLFLRRTNLVRDLTENLRLYMPIRDPAVR